MPEQSEPSFPVPVPARQSPAARPSFFTSPFAFFALCALLHVALSMALPGIGAKGLGFWASAKVRLWHFLLVLVPTFWVASVLTVLNEWRTHRTPWPSTSKHRLAAGVCFILAAILFVNPILRPFFSDQSLLSAFLARADDLTSLPDFRTKFLVLNMIAISVLLLLTGGMFGVQAQLSGYLQQSATSMENPRGERLEEDVRRYQQLRSQLERFLGFCAANIGFTILTSGALRDLLKEVAPGPPELLSAGAVVILGVYYTWLLAVIYLPIRKSMNEVGQALAEGLVRQSLVGRVTWTQWSGERQAIRAYLGLQGSALQDLQQGLSVMAPLFASISSLALGSTG
jgi:hypothetical protein